METKWKRSIVCFVLLAGMLSMTAYAGNQTRTGTAGAQELLLPVGARSVALGGSSMVFATGSEAIYWNPAGLSHLDHSVEAMVSQMQYIADIGVTYGALGVQAGEFGTLGFSIKSVNFGDIPLTTEQFPDGTGQNYSPSFLNIGVTYSKSLTDRIAVGLTTTVISEKILSTSATGIAFNIGLQYKNLGVQGLDLGITVRNVGPNMTFAGSDLLKTATASSGIRGSQTYAVQAAGFELPSSMEIGIGYTRKFDEKNSVLVGGMFRNNNYQDDEYNLGAEYSFNNLFFVRGGYTFSPQTNNDPLNERGYIYDYALGAGLHYLVGDIDLTFDYAYRHVKYFDANNVFSLKFGF